jgi:hypothetical protein
MQLFSKTVKGRCIVMCASARNILCMSLQSLGFLVDQIPSKLFECHEKSYFIAGLFLRNLKLKTNEIIGWMVEMKAELLLGSLTVYLPSNVSSRTRFLSVYVHCTCTALFILTACILCIEHCILM